MAPGVTVTTPSGAPGADGGAIRIRGINSFGGSSTAPLVLIDGIEGSLDSVDPVLIESISILKDAASSSIYGSRAANGVILVTTNAARPNASPSPTREPSAGSRLPTCPKRSTHSNTAS